MMTITLKRKDLYRICLVIWIISSVFFGRTMINGIIGDVALTIYSWGRIVTYVLLFCMMLRGGFTRRRTMEIIVISATLLFSMASSGEVVLFGVLLFVVAAKNVYPDEIVDVYFKTHLVVLIITVIFAMMHIIDMNIMHRGLIQRNSFGFSHPNSFGGEILTIVVCYITAKWEKLKNYELFIIIGIGLLFLRASDCRMASLVLILYALCVGVVKNIYKYNINIIVVKNVVILTFLVVIFVTVSMTMFYSDQNRIFRIMDGILSHRFDLMHSLYKFQGIKMFGQKIFDDNLVSIDNSYARVLLISGIIPFLILILFSISICNEFAKRNEIKYLLAFAATILSGFIENNFFRIENNFCFVIGGVYLLSRYFGKKKE